jgi:aminoglycoside phosphotransferase (APT) family kinase protein
MITEPTQDDLAPALARMGLAPAGACLSTTRLTGGVSSDIWRVDLADGVVCVKRASPQLRVSTTWLAPVERSRHEWNWFRLVHARLPGACPRPIARDEASNLFAMEFLPSERYALWKTELLQGRVDPDVGRQVGFTIGRIHALSAGDAELATMFATDACFHSLRLEPYLEATAVAHPDVAPIIRDIARVTAGTRLALVHGDLSPKNVLVGHRGPVLLDAECAWYGDPAFDVAFCLNHLLLKCLVRDDRIDALAASFHAFVESYCAEVTWEPVAHVLTRAGRLLPALLLARVDGRSPVEYLHEAKSQGIVRNMSKRWLDAGGADPRDLMREWREALQQ